MFELEAEYFLIISPPPTAPPPKIIIIIKNMTYWIVTDRLSASHQSPSNPNGTLGLRLCRDGGTLLPVGRGKGDL